MAEETYTLEQAATDLIEAPASAPAVYDPGTLEENTRSEPRWRGELTVGEAADLISDDAPTSGKVVAEHNGKPLKLQHLVQGFNEGMKLQELLADVRARYAMIEQAGRDMWTGANAFAELLTALVPPPSADLAITHPWEYQRRKVLYEQVEEAAVQIVGHAQGIARQNAEWAKAQSAKDNLSFGLACFLEDYPQARDPAWCNQFVARITAAAESCGYHADELWTITDHRAFKVLELAATALEKRQGGPAKRERAKPSEKPRLAPNRDDDLRMSDALLLDVD